MPISSFLEDTAIRCKGGRVEGEVAVNDTGRGKQGRGRKGKERQGMEGPNETGAKLKRHAASLQRYVPFLMNRVWVGSIDA